MSNERKRKRPDIDESIVRNSVTVDEFAGAMRAMLSGGEPEVRSENREPTKAELEQRWKLRPSR